ncbi:hypothetical protein B7463_g3144, partial [Scytalidium lignicola]
MVAIGDVSSENVLDYTGDGKQTIDTTPRDNIERVAAQVPPPRISANFMVPVNNTTNRRCQEWTTDFIRRLIQLQYVRKDALNIVEAHRDPPNFGIGLQSVAPQRSRQGAVRLVTLTEEESPWVKTGGLQELRSAILVILSGYAYSILEMHLLQVIGTTFVDRKNSASTVEGFQKAAEEMKRKSHSIWVFPESHRSNFQTPDLLPFKKGAFHIAIQSRLPIIPIVANNYSNLISWQGHRFDSGDIFVRVMDPIETKGLKASDAEDLLERTRAAMERELVELTKRALR